MILRNSVFGGFFYTFVCMSLQQLYDIFLESSGICTDTRNTAPNCIFFALKGDNFNGNIFAEEAIDNGALFAVVDEETYFKNPRKMMLVDDVLLTLQKLASHHRKNLKSILIALTGSNGKTTTKELIYAVLSQQYKTQATIGNFNNHIGVPKTLLRLSPETEIAVVEMGANHLGEISMLCEIADPDYGYITNFGKAHLEGFGSLKGVIKGKTELYRYLKNKNKKAFINGRNSVQIAHSEHMDRIIFGSTDSEFPIALLSSEGNLIVKFQNVEIQSNLTGDYNFENIAAAIAIGSYFKLSVNQIKSGIENYIPKNNRSEILQKGTNTILLDAYNANPTSMIAALKNFKKIDSMNKILILGDMFELGSEAAVEHQAIVDYLSDDFIGRTYLVGSNFAHTRTNIPFIEKFETFEELEKELHENPPYSAHILIKGSRGMALERVLHLL